MRTSRAAPHPPLPRFCRAHVLRLEQHVAGGAGGVVWKKCRCLDLIDASYKLFPAIFFLSSAVFLLFFLQSSGGRKNWRRSPRKTRRQEKTRRGIIPSSGELRPRLLLTRTDLKPDWLREVGALSASPRLMGTGFRSRRRSEDSCLATPYKT